MRRRGLVVVLFLLLALAISGCGGDDEDEASTTDPTPSRASTEPDSTKSGSSKTAPKKSGSKKHASGKGSNRSGSGHSTHPPDSNTEPRPPEGNPDANPGGTPVGTVPSGGGPTADERAVVRTVRAYLVAIARGDGVQACAQLTRGGRRAVERDVARAAPETKGSPCETSIELYQSSYRQAADGVKVTNVSLAGDRATAVALRQTASLVKRDRTWLIARYER